MHKPDEGEYEVIDFNIGDVDGDEDYEYFTLWKPTIEKSNLPYYLDCYELNGANIWRITLDEKTNEKPQYIVYDFNGDKKAEVCVICNQTLIVYSGDGYFLESMRLEDYDQITLGVAYLDGERPSLIIGRTLNGIVEVMALHYFNNNLQQQFIVNCKQTTRKLQLSVGDIDADGCMEIIVEGHVIDHQGKLLYTDEEVQAVQEFQLGNFNPMKPGLERLSVCPAVER